MVFKPKACSILNPYKVKMYVILSEFVLLRSKLTMVFAAGKSISNAEKKTSFSVWFLCFFVHILWLGLTGCCWHYVQVRLRAAILFFHFTFGKWFSRAWKNGCFQCLDLCINTGVGKRLSDPSTFVVFFLFICARFKLNNIKQVMHSF